MTETFSLLTERLRRAAADTSASELADRLADLLDEGIPGLIPYIQSSEHLHELCGSDDDVARAARDLLDALASEDAIIDLVTECGQRPVTTMSRR
ncbi:hypothetical protein [Azospirillum sp. TSO5]|uniref:hypothetical protein n=1 Tax=Azospirillum sp. TSO5 TaxID=716760 RepID=UPI000D61CE11|nr:hypothetical protein [Azospirillum sp. TSO5]PWC92888.1 hypothetical protein TSO5_15785 [Azospirillum sp. TSO5]